MAGEVWIIGASKGLGLAMAQLFQRRGRSVVGFARRPPADRSAFAEFVGLDAADPDAFDATVHRLFAERPAPDLIVYCAACVYQGPIVDQPERALRAEVEANYLGFVRLCQAVAAHKPAEARVRLVATGSTLGYVGCPSLDNYSACKAALISFARSARRELAAHGITIQILSPPHMDNGGADLVGPRQFTLAWSAERFVRATEGGMREHLLGASNRLVLVLARIAPAFTQRIMDGIGVDALKRGARRMPA
jgi:NAD(P)-dependent dehydrogenase (short-subunit alcohol dehydrogenase family)